jgi:hypothetical protein
MFMQSETLMEMTINTPFFLNVNVALCSLIGDTVTQCHLIGDAVTLCSLIGDTVTLCSLIAR